MLNDYIYYTSVVILLYQIFRAAWHWGKSFIEFMFGEQSKKFKPKIEKPRMFFHLITIGFSVTAFIQLTNFSDDVNYLNYIQLFYLIVIIFFGIMFHLTWCDIFKTRFVPAIKRSLNRPSSDFKSNYQYEEGIAIFRSLVSNGYLIYEDVNVQLNMEKQFIDILVKGVLPEKSLFYLQMNYHQINVIYERMLPRISQFPWDYFLRIFTDFEGEINLSSLQSSVSTAKKKMLIKKKNQYAREQNIIESIFLPTPKYG